MVGPAAPSADAGRHQRWGVHALQAAIRPLLPGLEIEVVASAPSTNSALLERARSAASAAGQPGGRRRADTRPSLLVAERQLAGRGRMGRSWQSVPDASLCFSLALALAPRDWSGLSLAVGVALAEALQRLAAPPEPRIALKWPNDLWLFDAGKGAAEGRKLGGVLIETLAAGDRRLAVIGVGLNIAPLPPALAAGIDGRTGCLREIAPGIDAPAALACVALPLAQALKTFEREGFAAFGARFAALDALRDQPVATGDARAPSGIARGVDGQGGLRVETPAGLHTLHGGEVSVRPAGLALPATAVPLLP